MDTAANEVEKQQEALLLQKYGGMKPKKHLLAKTSGRKCFDSADWMLAKEGRPVDDVNDDDTPVDQRPVKFEPSPNPPRRRSTLDAVAVVS